MERDQVFVLCVIDRLEPICELENGLERVECVSLMADVRLMQSAQCVDVEEFTDPALIQCLLDERGALTADPLRERRVE